MAHHPVGAEPLSDTMMTEGQLDLRQNTYVKFKSKYKKIMYENCYGNSVCKYVDNSVSTLMFIHVNLKL